MAIFLYVYLSIYVEVKELSDFILQQWYYAVEPLYKDTSEMRTSPGLNQDTKHGPRYIEIYTKLPLR